MSFVSLVSGGLDSTLMAVLAQKDGLNQCPLFIDYGQINRERELGACLRNFQRHELPTPKVVRLDGFGALLASGLTDKGKRILEDAFLPCRNLMFLTVGGAYAHQCGVGAVGIGLLDDAFSLFPDQTKDFVREAETVISRSLGKPLRVLTPLMSFSKAEVVAVAKDIGISGTYSCHAGTETPCGACVACREYVGLEV